MQPELGRLMEHINGAPAFLQHTAESISALANLPAAADQPAPPAAPFCHLSNRFRLSMEAGDAILLHHVDPQLVSWLYAAMDKFHCICCRPWMFSACMVGAYLGAS